MRPEPVESVPEFFAIYREPCNNCELYTDGVLCAKSHRQQQVGVATGHIPELTFRRRGGCPDWMILTSKTDAWWGEDPLYPCSGDYGGSKTNILG
jgi:hypothetical protein